MEVAAKRQLHVMVVVRRKFNRGENLIRLLRVIAGPCRPTTTRHPNELASDEIDCRPLEEIQSLANCLPAPPLAPAPNKTIIMSLFCGQRRKSSGASCRRWIKAERAAAAAGIGIRSRRLSWRCPFQVGPQSSRPLDSVRRRRRRRRSRLPSSSASGLPERDSKFKSH